MARRRGRDRLSYGAVVRSIWFKFVEARCLGMSAELGFWFLYSLFPFLIFVLAIFSLLPFAPAPPVALHHLKRMVPPSLYDHLAPMIDQVLVEPNGWLAAGTLIFALWSATAAVLSIIQTLDRLYEVRETRPLWRTTLVSLGITVLLVLVFVMAFTLLVAVPLVRAAVFGATGAPATISDMFTAFRLVIVVVTTFAVFAVIYAWAPNARWHWQTVLPGALFATAGFYAVSVAFRFYLQHLAYYHRLYGALGVVIALMTWLYLVGLIILVGGLVDGEIRHILLEHHPEVKEEEEKLSKGPPED